jgi:GT2 family glycosyltransferase
LLLKHGHEGTGQALEFGRAGVSQYEFSPGCVRNPGLALLNLHEPGAQGALQGILKGIALEPKKAAQGIRGKRLLGHGEEPRAGEGLVEVQALSGAVLMLSRAALGRVGRLDEDYYLYFEDTDWCLRARPAGLAVGVVEGARARHWGGRSFDPLSGDRFYYAARNHLRMVEKLSPLRGAMGRLRRASVVGLNLAHVLRQVGCARRVALGAVLEGYRDARRGRSGKRGSVS